MKFFNTIRRKLIGSGFGKYLLYAFGEIVLVVIGILLAITINNYSERISIKNKTTEQAREILEQMQADALYTEEYLQYLSDLKETIGYYRLSLDERKKTKKPLEKVTKLGLFLDRDQNMFRVGNRLIAQINNNDFSSISYAQLIYNIQADYQTSQKMISSSEEKIIEQNSRFNDVLSKKYDWFVEWKATLNCKNECFQYITNSPEFDKALVDFQYEKTFVYRIRIEEFQFKLKENIELLEEFIDRNPNQ